MGTDPPTVTVAVFNIVTGLHVGVCHTNKTQSLTVLGGSVSKHHPQVTTADIFNGNCHLGGSRGGINVNTGLYIWKKCCLLGH